MGVLLVLGLMMITLMRSALENWNQAERQRKIYSRARAVFDCLQDDLESALTRDPPGSPVVARMFCEPDTRNAGRQVLMLVRTFGSGPERPYTFHSGDALDAVDLPAVDPAKPRPDDEDASPLTGRVDEEVYNGADDDGDGHVDEDLAAAGGAAQVAYLHQGRQLKRAVCSPGLPAFRDTFAFAQPLADDVLFFDVLLATRYTSTWRETGRDGKPLPLVPSPKHRMGQEYGPERIWDSTRGVINGFSFFVGPLSAADGDDDVFPDRVRVTLVVESDEYRTVRTDTIGFTDEAVGLVRVASTRGFPPPGTEASYILVNDEWMHYSAMDERSFTIDRRGERRTARASHAEGSPVRCGTTFTRTFYLPGNRQEEAVGVNVR